MTKAIVVTATGTASANLYSMILAALSVTQLPQRVDQGVVFFPDFVSSVTFFNPSGTITIEDVSGNTIVTVASATSYTLGSGMFNNISLQALQLKSASGVTTNVSIVQI